MLMQPIARTPLNCTILSRSGKRTGPEWTGFRNQPEQDENRQTTPKCPL